MRLEITCTRSWELSAEAWDGSQELLRLIPEVLTRLYGSLLPNTPSVPAVHIQNSACGLSESQVGAFPHYGRVEWQVPRRRAHLHQGACLFCSHIPKQSRQMHDAPATGNVLTSSVKGARTPFPSALCSVPQGRHQMRVSASGSVSWHAGDGGSVGISICKCNGRLARYLQ